MPEALARVKRELGQDAVILGTRTCPPSRLGALVGRTQVEITAAPPQAVGWAPRSRPDPAGGTGARHETLRGQPATDRAATAQGASVAGRLERWADRLPNVQPGVTRRRPIAPAPLPDGALAYYQALVEREVAEQLAARIASQAAARRAAADGSSTDRQAGNRRQPCPPSPELLRQVLCETIAQLIPVAGGINLPVESADRPRRVGLVGPAGAGKTTTLAKLAAHFQLRCRRPVAIVSLDMQRIGGNEHLRRYAELIGVPMYAAQTVAEVKEVFRRLAPVELVLIDTHGVLPTDRGHFARLAALLRAARPDEVHLVLPAALVPTVQARLAERFAPLGVSRVVLTHLDEAVGLGVILNTIERLQWGLSYVTDGETVPNSIHEACPRKLAELIFQ